LRWALLAGFGPALAAACDGREPTGQDQSELSCSVGYEDFAGPFLLNWCVGCHSSALPEGQRQDAPVGVDFDTLDGLRTFSRLARIHVFEDRTMPPVGGPSPRERELFAQWIDCGMPAAGGSFAPPAPTGKPTLPASRCPKRRCPAAKLRRSIASSSAA
jgi:uncharacterized membrane protein